MTSRAVRDLSLSKRIAFSVLACVLALAVMEAALRLTGFEYRPGSVSIQRAPTSELERLKRSRELGWELEPGQAGANEDGFIGDRIPRKRTAAVPRVAALGDSCTQFGDPPYVEILRDELVKRLGRPVESLNAGVSGYSTHQGLLRWRRDVADLRPDVVVLYFGWNDHWVAQGMTDGGRLAVQNRPSDRWLWAIDHSRLLQAALMVADEMAGAPAPIFRVPIKEYEDNLSTMIDLVRDSGALPVLVTAPTNATSETPWGQFSQLPATLADAYESPRDIHDRYVETTRAVAARKNALLVDAARMFDGREGLIRADHIHPTQRGYEQLAMLLADTLEVQLTSEPAQ